jgi:alpha-glucosidase
MQNVSVQENDPRSMLSLYKRLIRIRQSEASFHTGEYIPVYSDHQMISFVRKAEGAAGFLVVLNLTHRPCFFRQPKDGIAYKGTIAVATAPELEGLHVGDTIILGGDEGIIVKLNDFK